MVEPPSTSVPYLIPIMKRLRIKVIKFEEWHNKNMTFCVLVERTKREYLFLRARTNSGAGHLSDTEQQYRCRVELNNDFKGVLA